MNGFAGFSLGFSVCALIVMSISAYEIDQRERASIVDSLNTIGDTINTEISGAAASDLGFLDKINKKFAAQHDYIPKVYTCVNYSRDYVSMMRGLGYNASVVVGTNWELNRSHAWVRLVLDVEPQTGEIVDYGLEYPR